MADALGLGPSARKGVEVQVLSPAPKNMTKSYFLIQYFLEISKDFKMRRTICFMQIFKYSIVRVKFFILYTN